MINIDYYYYYYYFIIKTILSYYQKIKYNNIINSQTTLNLYNIYNNNKSTYHIIKNIFKTKKLKYNYNKIKTLPTNTTNINITQLNQNKNYINIYI